MILAEYKMINVKNECSKWLVLDYVLPVLTQNEDIWSFNGSLTLNKGKQI